MYASLMRALLMAHGLSDLRKDWLSYGLQLGRLFNA